MRLYLVFMAGPNSLINLRELIEPVRAAFDGIVCVLHDSRGSEEDAYLTSVGAHVIHLPYTKRHDFSRQHYLYCGPIQNGDWCVQLDDKERLGSPLASNLRVFVKSLKDQGLNAAWYYGKPLLFEYHESLQYSGSPHEGLRRNDGQMNGIELSNQYPTESDIRYSVRASQRQDPYHWVGHYWRYYTFPWGSNQTLLGAEHRGDPMRVYQVREAIRAQLRTEIESRGVRWDDQAILEYWRANPLDDKMRALINLDKIPQDAYRHFILNDLTVRDEHDWVSLKAV